MRFLLPAALIICQLTDAQIVINEYSAANFSDFTDNYNEYEDWFELYNTGTESFDLNGYYLSDKSNNLTKYQINSPVVINSQDHLTIFASGRNTINGTDIHANFKIHQTKGNEWIILTAPDGATVVDSIFVRPCLVNQSRGRKIDGTNGWGIFTNPSPNNINSNSLNGYIDTPEFSNEPGSYDNPITLEISCPNPNTTIYYTLNGDTPNQGANVYTEPIVLNQTKVVKAIAVEINDDGYHPSFMEYGTFFISENFTLPIMSVSGNQIDNLIDNGNDNIEPWGTFEYYKDGELADKATGEFNEHGNDSWGYPQRGFDYITRDQFGYNYAIKDELFRTKDRNKYQRLIIKTAANDNYPFSYGGSGAHIRDSYVQSLSQVADLRMDERSFEPCILFLNGEYWGLYEIREKVDDNDFTDYYYDQDSVEFLKTWGGSWADVLGDNQTENSVYDSWDEIREFITTNDMSIQNNYLYAKSIFNMGSLIDYFILNTYVVNADWLNWNTAWWHGLREDGEKKKWRYVLWDMDNTFDHGANYTDIPSQDVNSDPCDPESIGDTGGQGHIPIWNALLNNDEFFADYINRWTDLSNNYFSCEFLISHLDSLINLIEPEMPMQIDRWGGNYNTWQSNVNDMRDFIEERCEIINSGILDCYEDEYEIEGPYSVTINIQPPLSGMIDMNEYSINTSPFTGSYFGGITQQIDAFAADGYFFENWEFTNSSPSGNLTNESIEYTLTSNEIITAYFSPIIYGCTDQDAMNYNEDATLDDGTCQYTILTISVSENLGGIIVINGVEYSNFPSNIIITDLTSIEAISIEGYEFDYWELSTGTLENENNQSTNLFIDENASLIAYFSPMQVEITFDISHSDGGVISINDSLLNNLPQTFNFTYGETYSINIELNDNFNFNNWYSPEGLIENENSSNFSINIEESGNIIANLIELFKLTLIIEPQDAGYVLGDGEEMAVFPLSQIYLQNTQIDLQSIATSGMEFDYWVRDNAILGQDNIYQYTIEFNDTLRVVFSEKELAMYIPNSFTPNGDGVNDVFKPISDPSKIKKYEMQLFNEWGELIFETDQIEQGWDGISQANSSNNIFIYKIIVYSEISGSKYEYMGTVMVL
ncbi:MAG: CotH kinase family protein [Candidatus Marinimicrobia bacterium]|nr:CotH kinase family protein [Candidatus Neomarinimicrobiota bacterium]